ncbi:amino acid permease [Mammaliicoccus sp. Dog046]|uniref:amino acid permease n=1 Tax=Mammaliicoccus sp. Dog046 TaxID=3034233 RepID=UPI002B25E39F|nr:amino acid permease [Mammaliicoccus sp. Dog046]WQK85733.1 amino acid permease [Mammaliicoccus sp. Dog046]
MNQFFKKKDWLSFQTNKKLKKTLGAFDLTMLGVGAVVGSGIFILPGEISSTITGPGIMISFIIAAIGCGLAALCYSEFSSKIPQAGSAYTYSYYVFGEGIAWILGWALLLEYGLAIAAVASGWSSYVVNLLSGMNIHITKALSGSYNPEQGQYFDLPAFLIIAVIGVLLIIGVRESTRINNIMVVVKILVVLLFILVGAFYVKPDNWTPFLPFGFNGVLTGASMVFFAYIGFDAVSSAAEEVKNPQKNMPIGIIAALSVCTLLYIIVSAVLTGVVPYQQLEGVGAPVAFALQSINQNWVAGFLSLGAIVGMTTVIFVMAYGGTRLIFAISRDGLLPKILSKTNHKQTPVQNTIILTISMGIVSGLVPLAELASLINIGTLFAFCTVSIGVIFLRKNPNLPTDGFNVPFYPVLPIISCVICLYLMTNLSQTTWIAFIIWFILGIIIYFTYGIRHSKLKTF